MPELDDERPNISFCVLNWDTMPDRLKAMVNETFREHVNIEKGRDLRHFRALSEELLLLLQHYVFQVAETKVVRQIPNRFGKLQICCSLG